MPSVSFVIPSYNYADHIGSAIESALSVQQDGDEIIVVDDGSTDDTKAILSRWIDDEAITYIFQDNSGVSAARNAGTQLASRDYISFLDADDRLIDSGFRRLRKAVTEQPDKALIFGGHSSLEGTYTRRHLQQRLSGNKIQNFIDYVINRRFSIANGGAVLIQREIALKYPYPEELKVSEDFCVYAWVLANESAASITDEVVEVKKHPASLRNQVLQYANVIEILPGVLFDSSRLPEILIQYKRLFCCNRQLSLFRAQYIAQHYKQAKKTYIKALKCRWLNIIKLSYLRKYLRCLLK